MFKEILQIIPRVSSGELSKMERSLSGRFKKVAVGFGKGLVGALKGGGVAGAALGIIDKLLNPLAETQAAIDKTLQGSDDLVTNAKQFNTTSGKLARLRAVGQAAGLAPDNLDLLITKFQTAVAEATADPTKATSVRQFVGVKDSADAFFEFIQGLKNLDSTQQILVQKEVFGEKQILKVADFLQSAGEIALKLKGPSADKLTGRVDKLGALNDQKSLLEAQQDLGDLFKKGDLINASFVKSAAERRQIELDRENRNIQAYNDLSNITQSASVMVNTLRDMSLTFTNSLLKITNITESLKKFEGSNMFKGIIKFLKVD